MENETNTTTAACDCSCPVHHGRPRLSFTDEGCRCTIVCASQPLTLIAKAWAAALFLTAEGDLWHVTPNNVAPHGADVPSPGRPCSGDHTVWDWANAAPIPEHHKTYHADKVITVLLRQLATAIASDCPGEPPSTSQAAERAMPPIRYTGIIQDGTSVDDLIPSVNVFGTTEDEIYQGIFTTIAERLTAGELHDAPNEWLEQNPIAAVRVGEPGAAQQWLEGLSEQTTILYWTVLGPGALRDMRQPPRHGR